MKDFMFSQQRSWRFRSIS